MTAPNIQEHWLQVFPVADITGIGASRQAGVVVPGPAIPILTGVPEKVVERVRLCRAARCPRSVGS